MTLSPSSTLPLKTPCPTFTPFHHPPNPKSFHLQEPPLPSPPFSLHLFTLSSFLSSSLFSSPLPSPPSILPQTPSFSFTYFSFTPHTTRPTTTHPINQGMGVFEAADEGVNVCNNAIILCQKVGDISLQNISNLPRGTEKCADGGNWRVERGGGEARDAQTVIFI